MIYNPKQEGAVLIIGLIILTVMSIIVTAGMKGAITNERIASNYQANETSFQAAESGAPYVLGQKDIINTSLGNLGKSSSYNRTVAENELSMSVVSKRVPVPGFSLRTNAGYAYYILEITTETNTADVDTAITSGYVTLGAN